MRALMCQPDFFRVQEVINVWMSVARQPRLSRARRQWQNLFCSYHALGVELWCIEPEPGLQDMCFTANAGWCNWGKMILSQFYSHRIARARQGEIAQYARWFTKFHNKFTDIEPIPFPVADMGFEGQGDVITIGEKKTQAIILIGYGQGRTDRDAAHVLAELHGLSVRQIIPLRLIDPRFYHLDTACLFVPPRMFVYYPPAFSARDRRTIAALPVDHVAVSEKDALRFVCNGVFVKHCLKTNMQHPEITVLMNRPSAALRSEIESRGYGVCSVPMDEFRKGGGSLRCLTLFIPELEEET